jgi:hypothetical protein
MSASTPVIFATAEHLMRGVIATGRQRLVELLNDESPAYVKVQDAKFHRLGAPQLVKEAPEVLMPKATIGLAILPGEKHESPDRRMYAFVEKGRCEIFVVCAGFEIEGHISLKRNAEPLGALDFEFRMFFPVTAATINCGSQPDRPIHAPVVFVNKTYASAICFGTRTNAPLNLDPELV